MLLFIILNNEYLSNFNRKDLFLGYNNDYIQIFDFIILIE